MSTTFLHPMTSSVSVAQKLNVKNLEANHCRHLQLPIARRPSIVIPGLVAPTDEFPWLHYLLDDQESLFMYCALCTKRSKL